MIFTACRFTAQTVKSSLGPRVKKFLSCDHFSVDGTLIEAWASTKSIEPNSSDEPPAGGGGRNAEANFHDQKWSKETHFAITNPEPSSTAKARKPTFVS